MTPPVPLLAIGGPTASGKTELSLRIADALAAEGVQVEIVSADSRQVYRGLDIGTAKVTPAQRARVRHHGLDLVEPDEAFTLVDFARHVEPALAGLAERADTIGRAPLALLIGGTGLYLRAIARGIDPDALPSDAELRARLEAELTDGGLVLLAERLRDMAPTLAATIDLRNPRRVVRALEIATLAGDRPRPPFRGYQGPVALLGLELDAATHRARIAERARQQFASGLVEEARDLRERFDPALPAFSAIGYREAWAVLDGRRSLEAAIDDDVRRNLAFARRQRTWLRSEPALRWVAAGEGRDPLASALDAARALLQPVVDPSDRDSARDPTRRPAAR